MLNRIYSERIFTREGREPRHVVDYLLYIYMSL